MFSETEFNADVSLIRASRFPDNEDGLLKSAIDRGFVDYYTEISAIHAAFYNTELSDDDLLILKARFDLLTELGLNRSHIADWQDITLEKAQLTTYYEGRIPELEQIRFKGRIKD